jgi:hypothetical protein
VIQKFIREKKWKYCDDVSLDKKNGPFRDEGVICILGSPNLSYHVNCHDLSNLFMRSAKQIGLEAELVPYWNYKSISSHEKERAGIIIGPLRLFDQEIPKNQIEFDCHVVVLSSGWFFDLTLMCKYQGKNAVLDAHKDLCPLF